MVLRIALLAALVVAGILIYATTKPDTFSIQRSRNIQASPEKVFALVNNLHNWSRWHPEGKDSETKRTFSGPEAGVGAICDWQGTGSTGRGRMTITGSTPHSTVEITVDWVKPFRVRNINEFTFEPDGTSTQVTWSMHGPNLYIMKLMSVFTDMDKVMGKHFETALNSLQAVAE